MQSDQLTVMQKHETPPCISIVVSMEGARDQGRKAALMVIDRSVAEAVAHLKIAYPDKTDAFKSAFQSLRDELESAFDPSDMGIGLYVTNGFSRMFRFSFPVQTKICFGETFAVREILYQEQFAAHYLVIHIEEKEVHVYRGRLNHLEEIRDERFPLMYTNEYEYNEKIQEKDKSIVSANRQKAFYKDADQRLSSYLYGQAVILTGPTKDIGYWEEVNHHKDAITATVHGNYTNQPLQALEERCWPAVKNNFDTRDQKILRELSEKTNNRQVVDGIRDVLDAAREGKGDKLVIENDFISTDFTDKLTGRLRTKSPEATHEIDAVEDVMRAVIDKNGEIVFVRHGILDDHKHIALITRY